jgi:hypothetical protein
MPFLLLGVLFGYLECADPRTSESIFASYPVGIKIRWFSIMVCKRK